jgi:hypothetical protein
MITAHKMKPTFLLLLFFVMSLAPAVMPFAHAQHPQPKEPEDIRLPSGKMQKDEILKADHEKTLEDAARLLKAAEDLKIELEKTDMHVLSVSTLKQLDNIDRLTKRLRSRLKKY